MSSLDHFAEPRPPHGGLVAEGALNLLGRPDLDPLVVLMREAVQNSWDARVEGQQVTVDVARHLLTAEQRRTLASKIFTRLPAKGLFNEEAPGTIELASALETNQLDMLTVTDRGTSGLGGPLRADLPAQPGQLSDFVDLVFNIGQPPDKAMGGGTYGFGKTISFLVSACRTVILHTSTMHEGRQQERLIASAIGNQFADGRRNFTGRHWWGALAEDRVEPATDESARHLAAEIGLPAFAPGELGTTIAIIAPQFGDRTDARAMRFMSDAIAWHFWPKMVASKGALPSMRFTVTDDGTDVPIPDPRQVQPLRGFVEALEAVRECESGRRTPAHFPTMHIQEVRSQRPKATLGWLAMHAVPHRTDAISNAGEEAAAPFSGAAHHVALMRRAELVVQYRPGPGLATNALQWCGVFRASEEADRAFAASEPPTHDDWRSALVDEHRKKVFVNVALKKIREYSEAAFQPVPADKGTEGSVSAAAIADRLGGLILPGNGSGVSPAVGRPSREGVGAASRSRNARIDIGKRWLEEAAGGRTLCIDFTVQLPDRAASAVVEAVVGAASADGSSMEGERPAGAPVPEVLSISAGSTSVPGPTIEVTADNPGPWTVRVSQPSGVATVVDLRPARRANLS